MLASPLDLPYLTADLSGTGGRLRASDEDFCVEELPLEPPAGAGPYQYLWVEKRGVATTAVLALLARRLRVSERDVGHAGHKDAHAIARQFFSLPPAAPAAAPGPLSPQAAILAVTHHDRPLRPGRLAGNRFVIRIRGVAPDAETRAAAVLDVLARRGVPNAFGPQRFGVRENSHLIGRALLHHRHQELLDEALGAGAEAERSERSRRARALYCEGRRAEALAAFPPGATLERHLLGALVAGAAPADAVKRLRRSLRTLLVSAYQSWFFNRVLARRMAAIDRLEPGDWAYHHASGRIATVGDEFRVPSSESRIAATRHQPLETPAPPPGDAGPDWSATAPLPGARCPIASGGPGALEAETAAEAGETLAGLRAVCAPFRTWGERRPLRVFARELSWGREQGDPATGAEPALRLSFTLPAGSFATSLLREVMKSPIGG